MITQNSMDIEQDDTNLLKTESSHKLGNESLKQDEFTTPPKQIQHENQNSNTFIQNSPSFLNQFNTWKDSLEKYQNGKDNLQLDPEIAKVISQMNETIQNHSRNSGSNNLNITPKKQHFDEQSFSLGNNSFNFDCVFQKITEKINYVQDEIQNQSCQSPRAGDLSKLCNETCSEIKQQLHEIETNFRCNKIKIQLDKDEELSTLNQQLEKEFNICRNLKQCETSNNASINQSLEITKRYQKLQDLKRNKIIAFKKQQNQSLFEIRKSCTEIKSFLKTDWPAKISQFQEELLSEASQFKSSSSDQQQEMISEQDKQIKLYQIQIEELNQIVQMKNDEINQMQEKNKFFNELLQTLRIDRDTYSNFQQQKQIILHNIEILNAQKMISQQIQESQQATYEINLRNLEQLKRSADLQLLDEKNKNQQFQHKYNEIVMMNEKLIQELDNLKQNYQITTHKNLNQIIVQQSKQQIELVFIVSTIFQSFINSTANQIKIIDSFKDQSDLFESNLKHINEIQNIEQNKLLEIYTNNQTLLEQIISIICKQYNEIINKIKQSRLEWMQSL